jgi:hypothetical protein
MEHLLILESIYGEIVAKSISPNNTIAPNVDGTQQRLYFSHESISLLLNDDVVGHFWSTLKASIFSWVKFAFITDCLS